MKYKAMNNKLCAKGTKLLEHSRGNGPAGAGRLLLLFVPVLALLVCLGCASTQNAGKETLKANPPTLITGLELRDNTVKITADNPFIYTIYKPGDPYRMIIELPDVSLGAFTKKIINGKAGITELIPSQTEPPALMSKLEVFLQDPSSYEQEYKNNVLTVKVKEYPDPAKSETAQNVKVTDLLREKEPAMKGEARFGPPAATPGPSLVPQTPLQNATEISGISFEQADSYVKVLIKGNGSMVPNIFPLDNRIVIDIPEVSLNTSIPDAVLSPVKAIRSGKYDDKVRLVIDLKEDTRFDVAAIGDSIVVTLRRPGSELATVQAAQPNPETAELPASETEEVKVPSVLTGSKCESYLAGNENVNFDFQDQEIKGILKLLAKISGCNITIHPDVKGVYTMDLINVPWDQALDNILKSFNLGKKIEGNIIRVAPSTVFTKENEEKAKSRDAQEKSEPLETGMFDIRYAEVSVVEAAIKNAKILSSRGNLNVDKRTSSMLVKDIASVFPQIESLLATLDKPTPQVLIEARIVEVNTNSAYELGIQWGVNLNFTNTLGSIGGLKGVPLLSSGAVTGQNYLVDFPATGAGPLSGSGFTFGIMDPSKSIGLDMQLSAIETMGKLKVVSNPKILTVDNGMAKISQGKSIPVRKLTTEGTVSTEFKDVTLDLTVTPHITPDKSISMNVEIKKEELDPTVPSVEGVPGTDKKEAKTNVIIRDGETIVIGGMYKVTTNDSQSGVPGLMNLPILGWLFKSNKTSQNTTELLIFITPRVLPEKH